MTRRPRSSDGRPAEQTGRTRRSLLRRGAALAGAIAAGAGAGCADLVDGGDGTTGGGRTPGGGTPGDDGTTGDGTTGDGTTGNGGTTGDDGTTGSDGTTRDGDGPDRPGDYEPLGRLPVEGAMEAVVADDGTTVAVAASDGVALADVGDPADPTLLAERRGILADREGGPLEEIRDVAVDGDRLLAVGPANPGPALTAAVLFDVADPADPVRVAVHETSYAIHNADLVDGVAYLTGNDGERNPLVVVDLAAGSDADGGADGETDDGAGGGAGTELARWSVLDADPAWADVPSGLRPVHDVAVTDGVAALSYWDAGTWLLDVSDPAAPTPVGSVTPQSPADLAGLSDDAAGIAGSELPGNSHYALVAPGGDLLGVGREAWDADGDGEGGPGGIDLYAIDDLSESDGSGASSPERVGHVAPPPTPDPSRDGPWTTAHNFGFRDDRLYASWYRGGVTVHDVSDPSSPTELAAWREPSRTAFWTAVPADGCFVASSTAYFDGVEGALYAFPDEPGRQTDPPPIGDESPSW